MMPYLTTLSARFRMLLQYRAAALAGVVTQVFFGIVRVMIFQAFYRASSAEQPLTGDQTTTYVWLGQAFLMLVMLGVDGELATLIRSGNIAYELMRPVDLHSYWMSRMLATRLAPTFLRAGPIIVVAALLGQLLPPASMGHLGLAAVSISLGMLLATALYSLVTISLLWTISGEGAARLAPPVVFFLSGMIIPIPLFPDWCQPLMSVLPFRGLIDTPFRIYLGTMTFGEAGVSMVQQVVWTAVFVVAGRWLLGRGLRRLVVQGG